MLADNKVKHDIRVPACACAADGTQAVQHRKELSLPTSPSSSLPLLAFLLSPLPSHLLLLLCHHKIILSTWPLALSSPQDVGPCPLVYQWPHIILFIYFNSGCSTIPHTHAKIAFSLSGNAHGFYFVHSAGYLCCGLTYRPEVNRKAIRNPKFRPDGDLAFRMGQTLGHPSREN